MKSTILELKDISFGYSDKTILSSVSLEIKASEFVVFVGSSGCGKSTLMRIIAGLEMPTFGKVILHSSVNKADQQQTPLAYLFQDYDSFPWLNVWDNLIKGSGSEPITDFSHAEHLLHQVGLWEHRHKYPSELSGGMRKRLGLARCLVRQPAILLLDEPFSSLDIAIRNDMYTLVQQLAKEVGCTILLVSHDLHEMLLLADRLFLCSKAPMKMVAEISNEMPHPRGEDILDDPFYRQTHHHLIEHLTATR